MTGTSLGGMVACEIANQLRLESLVLIGSAKHKREINTLLRTLAPLVDLTPLEFIKKTAGKLDTQLTEMFAQSEPRFIRNMCKAIFKWDGLKADPKLLRIHGTQDHIIPIPLDTDVRIDGGHLIVMKNAEACVEPIIQFFQ